MWCMRLMYTPRPWHSTSYNNLVWQCRNRTKRGLKCPGYNVYDRLLHFIIYDAARTAAFKRGVLQTVADIVTTIIGEKIEDVVQQWLHTFRSGDAWEMLSDEDDLAVILQCINVMPNRTLKIRWLDGKKSTYHLPKYSPKRGIEHDNK